MQLRKIFRVKHRLTGKYFPIIFSNDQLGKFVFFVIEQKFCVKKINEPHVCFYEWNFKKKHKLF